MVKRKKKFLYKNCKKKHKIKNAIASAVFLRLFNSTWFCLPIYVSACIHNKRGVGRVFTTNKIKKKKLIL